MEEYFKLYQVSSKAVKEVDENFKVGGPAVCGGSDKEWVKAFLEFVSKNKCPLDFVTRHHYTTEFPAWDGHYGYPKLHPKEKCWVGYNIKIEDETLRKIAEVSNGDVRTALNGLEVAVLTTNMESDGYIHIKVLQISGKRKNDVKDFLRGNNINNCVLLY